MAKQSVTVEHVREAQNHFKSGIDLQKEKKFKEAIEEFKSCAAINPVDENHVSELTKKLKVGSFKIEQEGIAFMGCAAVHLNGLVNELTDEEKEAVPIEESLKEVFESWG